MKQYFLIACLALLVFSCSKNSEPEGMEKGVPLSLAMARKALISNVNYRLEFRVPAQLEQPIQALETLSFNLSDISENVLLDFRESADKIKGLIINDKPAEIDFRNEHIVLDKSLLRRGKNIVEINFFAGETSLNRKEEFLYTLFVPDRARTAFPCFDQPNLKATYDLTLDIPAEWNAIANAPVNLLNVKDGRKNIQFEQSDLISTYLFSFVAGEFKAVSREINGRPMTMLHRETDSAKVARNLDLIFYLHDASIKWLEGYTGITYPFKKLDFALIPSFQYGGMEHVGAIQYQANSLFLDEDPSQSQLLGRASLIAHETAHMWFGDLVTMDWFNDVWTKEVFANFMAAKMVNPSFPEIDHELNFLVRHYPSAYSVDRTEGANPIRQQLNNLNEAGQMYGAIIYNKAPIMMRQLEMLVGEKQFQEGLQEYLKTYAKANATWPNLIDILDKRTPEDLRQWSEVWVNTPGRPEFKMEIVRQQGMLNQLKFVQLDPSGQNRVWPQQFGATAWLENTKFLKKIVSKEQATDVDLPIQKLADVLLMSKGRGYGLFEIDMAMLSSKYALMTDLEKGVALLNLHENFLEGTIKRMAYLENLQKVIEQERNELLLNLALGQLNSVYWTFLTEEEREAVAVAVETLMYRSMMDTAITPSLKKIFFNAFRNVTISSANTERLYKIWSGDQVVKELSLSENDKVALAGQLAIRMPEKANEILDKQLADIQNPDTRRRFEFVRPALSNSAEERDDFFESLKDEKNRETESWVLSALGYLHHPLRGSESEKYILPSLELLKEIQETGDIFFPSRWLGQTMASHNSSHSVKTVRDFLSKNPDYNAQLRMKILQSADDMFRAERILTGSRDLKQK